MALDNSELYINYDKENNKAITEYKTDITGDIIMQSPNNAIYIGTGTFTGAALGYADAGDGDTAGHANLIFAEGGTWKVTADSELDSLVLNGGTIDMSAAKNEDGKVPTLTVHNGLTGDNIKFKLHLDWLANQCAKNETKTADGKYSQYLYINGTGSKGNYLLDFDASEANLDKMTAITVDGEEPKDKLYFAYVAGGNDVTFQRYVSEANAQYINNYTFVYDLNKDANSTKGGDDWYVYTSELEKDIEDFFSEGKLPASKNPNENVTLAKQSLKANYALATEMDSLHKRLGEARYIEPGENSGVWVRYRRARTAWENSFKNNSNTFQVGLDKEYKEKDGRHLRGISLEYMDASTSLSGLASHGDNKRYALGIYDTWQGDKGHYYDLVLRGGRLNSEYDVLTSGNQKINTDYHQWFAALSGEYGRKLELKNSWYVEPQVQLQVARIFSADYATNYGVRMEQDAATSLIGRAGFRVGKDLQTAGGKQRGSVYFKADLLHEFCGDLDYKLSDTRDTASGSYDASSTWWDVGVGASLELSKTSAIYLDVERTLGGDFDRTWQINAGFNYIF